MWSVLKVPMHYSCGRTRNSAVPEENDYHYPSFTTCQNKPVTCWSMRSTEKTIFLRYMVAMSIFSILEGILILFLTSDDVKLKVEFLLKWKKLLIADFTKLAWKTYNVRVKPARQEKLALKYGKYEGSRLDLKAPVVETPATTTLGRNGEDTLSSRWAPNDRRRVNGKPAENENLVLNNNHINLSGRSAWWTQVSLFSVVNYYYSVNKSTNKGIYDENSEITKPLQCNDLYAWPVLSSENHKQRSSL